MIWELFPIQSSFRITIPKVTWRKSGDFFKCVRKVVRVGIADVISNLGDGVIGFAKLGFGILHLGLQNKLLNGYFGPFFEVGSQIFPVVSEVICNIRDMKICADI